MDKQQIVRIPKKYWPILQTISDESVGKIFKGIFLWQENLEGIEKIYYDLIMTDINNIQSNVEIWQKFWNLGWRPKKKGGVIEKETGGLWKTKPNTIQYNTITIQSKTIKDKIEEEKLYDILWEEELQKFISYRSEPFMNWKNKWKEKRLWQETWDTKKRLETRKRNAETWFWKKVENKPNKSRSDDQRVAWIREQKSNNKLARPLMTEILWEEEQKRLYRLRESKHKFNPNIQVDA